MSLPLPLAQAADLFTETTPLTAFDVSWTRVNGRQDRVQGPDYTFSGVIQPKDDRKVDLGADGALSDGTMLMHTRQVLFVSDLSQESGELIIQTYVKFNDELWKVNAPANWPTKTQNYKVYELTKYTNLDLA